jgi:hypothetical protein
MKTVETILCHFDMKDTCESNNPKLRLVSIVSEAQLWLKIDPVLCINIIALIVATTFEGATRRRKAR